ILSLMKLRPPARRATRPVLCRDETSPSTAARLTRQRFHRSAVLPENAIATLRDKWLESVEARPALARLALNSKPPAVRTQSVRLLLVMDAPVPNRDRK